MRGTPLVAAECVPNIGPAQRRGRLLFGLAAIAVGVVVAGVMIATGVDRGWRVLLLLPFWAGSNGYFQSREHTCVGLASRGQRDMDSGPERIEDAAELEKVRRQARLVYWKGGLSALALTGLALLVPSWATPT
jgi:hypothetical protein